MKNKVTWGGIRNVCAQQREHEKSHVGRHLSSLGTRPQKKELWEHLSFSSVRTLSNTPLQCKLSHLSSAVQWPQ